MSALPIPPGAVTPLSQLVHESAKEAKLSTIPTPSAIHSDTLIEQLGVEIQRLIPVNSSTLEELETALQTRDHAFIHYKPHSSLDICVNEDELYVIYRVQDEKHEYVVLRESLAETFRCTSSDMCLLLILFGGQEPEASLDLMSGKGDDSVSSVSHDLFYRAHVSSPIIYHRSTNLYQR